MVVVVWVKLVVEVVERLVVGLVGVGKLVGEKLVVVVVVVVKWLLRVVMRLS